jgi:pentatricopeptide repeat protein
MVPRDNTSNKNTGKNKKSKLIKDTEVDTTRKTRSKWNRNIQNQSESYISTEPVPPQQINPTLPPPPPIQTLSGGVSLIFSMARRMLLWDEEQYHQQQWNDASPPPPTSDSTPNLPRWHPIEGIADLNPSFRSEAPVMNNKGYAQTIRRNSRKKRKASLWRYALRIYNKMKDMEEEQAEQRQTLMDEYVSEDPFWIQRRIEHYEAALVACAKLGLFQEAMRIYQDIEEKGERNSLLTVPLQVDTKRSKSEMDRKIKQKERDAVRVTRNMILSIVKTCVRQRETSRDEKLLHLKSVLDILESLKEKHGISVEAMMVNPIAAAYVKLGHVEKAFDLMDSLLASKNRSKVVTDESFVQPISFHWNDSHSKDRSSYNILVEGALSKGDYSLAVEQLRDMTRNGHFPNSRSLNTWNRF